MLAESFLGCAYRCAERRFAGLGCTIGAGRRTPPLMIDERIAALSVRALRSKGAAPRMRQKRVETIVAIQVLRAITALAVVLSHSAFDLQRFGYGSPVHYRIFISAMPAWIYSLSSPDS
jgi:hypothetical protein